MVARIMVYFLTACIAICLHVSFCLEEDENAEPLFTEMDPLQLLDSGNFRELVVGSPQAWFINFYNSWCGHCIRFAPDWKSFGSNVTGWHKFLKVGAVDCSIASNTDLCRQYRVDGYPTLKFFPPHASSNDTGLVYTDTRENDILIKSSVDYLKVNGSMEVQHLLKPLNSLEEFTRSASRKKLLAVVFDDEELAFADSVVLDCSGMKSVVVRRGTRSLAKKYQIGIYPSMFLLTGHGNFKLVTSAENRDFYKKSLDKFLGVHLGITDGLEISDKRTSENQNNQTTSPKNNRLYMEDLESTITYALLQDIGTCPTMDGDRMMALNALVTCLVELFPASVDLHEKLVKLQTWLSTHVTITGDEWSEVVKHVLGNSTLTWVSCRGSTPRYRGYPCGLWRLFHTLTVQAYLKGSKQEPDAHRVLRVMKLYISNFFGCRECAKNFEKETIGWTEQITTLRDAVLYLWRVHNSVNKRLSGDITEDPQHRKIQFPSSEQCSTCRLEPSQEYVQDEVLTYLTSVYSHISYYHPAAFAAVSDRLSHLHSTRNQLKRQLSILAGFDGLDISLCLLLYLVMGVCIAVLYYHFLVRRKYKCWKSAGSLPL